MEKSSSTTNELNSSSFYELAEVCSDVLFWEADENLKITYINQALTEHVGLDPEILIGRKVKRILNPSEGNCWSDITKSISYYKDIKFTAKTKNGKVSHLLVSGKTIYENDEIIGFYGICTIETENIITKQVIQKLQTTNRTILNSLREALIIVDNDERFIVISPEFYKLWEFEKGDLYLNTKEETINKMRLLLFPESEDVSLSFTQFLGTNTKTTDILKFKDGRVVERKSVPHIREGKLAGTCWYFKNISQQVALIDKLGKLAFRDSLTKLYSRRWCEKKLKQLLKNEKEDSLSFLYMDLDYFKTINDSCGHLHGDDVLAEISQLLLDTIGKKSYLSRLGGDEFGLILSQKSTSQVLAITENIIAAVDSYTYRWKGKIFKLGISIGAVFIEESDSFRSVFANSDEACYLAKTTGRHKCVVYNSEKEEFKKTRTQLKWYDAIQIALLKGNFELWCQPISNSKSKKVHYEVLLRMISEDDKLVSPALFMEAADRFGMIYTIDKLVLDSFFKFYSENHKTLKHILFSINISGNSLSQDTFLEFIINGLDRYSIDCKNICFEITESEIIENFDEALSFINEIRKKGCKISLDDFGKGMTSFSYLKDIPYDYIKIDGQFIKEINKNKINKAIIKSIVYISEVMGKKTIAEHIENKEILNQIKELGVDYFQGNYFSKPHKITKLLE